MDPAQQELLQNFKELLDEGLITAAEYEAKKNEVMSMSSTSRPVSTTSSMYGGLPEPRATTGAIDRSAPSMSIDDLLNDLGDASLDSRPSQAASQYPRQTQTPAGEQDLDYLVEMMGGGPTAPFAGENAEQYAVGGGNGVGPPQDTSAISATAAPPPDADEHFINVEHVLKGHKGFVFDCAFHGNRLFTASADKTIIVWDLATMAVKQVLRGHTHSVYCLLVDAPNKRLFSGSWDLSIRVWNIAGDDIKEMRTITGHTGYISCLRIFDGKLYSGSWNAIVKIHDLKTLRELDNLSLEHTGTIYDICFARDLIFTASSDNRIKTWNAKSNNYRDNLGEIGGKQHTDWVFAIVPVGDELYSASRDKSIKVWDLTERHIKDIHTIECAHEAPITCMRRKGNYLITGDGKGFLRIWSIETKECVDEIKAHTMWINSIHIVGNYIFTCSRDKTVKIWQ